MRKYSYENIWRYVPSTGSFSCKQTHFHKVLSAQWLALKQRHKVNSKMAYVLLPCIRLARLKFELTNQDSAGRKKVYCPDVNVS